MTNDLDDLAVAWRQQGMSPEELLRAVRRAHSRLYFRRFALVAIGVVACWMLFMLVLLGFEGRLGAMTYAFVVACAALMPLWLIPLIKHAWPPALAGLDARHLAGAELQAQEALIRTLRWPLPQVALSLCATVGIYIVAAQRVFLHRFTTSTVIAAVIWFTLAVVAWSISWRSLGNALHARDVLAAALGREVPAGRRTRVPLLVAASLCGLLVIAAVVVPVSWIGPSRDWEEQLEARDQGRSPGAEIAAHRIARMDARFAHDGVPGVASRLDVVARVRDGLTPAAANYLSALRSARAQATEPAIDVEQARATWLYAAEDALSASRIGPRELATMLAAAEPDAQCLQLPAPQRLPWLSEHAPAPTDTDCLLASLEDPSSPLKWTTRTSP